MIVRFDGDVEKVFADLATYDSGFTTWFHARVARRDRRRLAAPPEGPPPAVLVDWSA